MAARSSTVIVQEPFNPVLPPIIDLKAQGNLVYKDNETDAGPDAFVFNTEKFVDFESLKANGIDVQSLFFDQQWKNYFEMPDQNQVGEASDKGKDPIIDTTPPASPKFEPGSPSTPIPPAVQSALDNIKSELAEDIKDEIDILRIDLRSDLTSAIAASEEATHRRMDAMMQTLLKAISDIKKP
ncbi:hypothetical protein QL285_059159 [Trifolium repens]|nr:hypothetical protein QL285_059159 [Trifolium repens]